MATLTREQRKLLENTVVAARDAAERGADKILTSLRAGNRDAPEKLSPKDTRLRNQLRAHGRQLGDKRHPSGEQETTHLKQACAYEHWHRLLFARFLAENDLLISPEYGVAMSLPEIQETARAQNLDWLSLASDYAQRMLLEVFRPDDPVLQVQMPPENRQELEEKLSQLPTEIFLADDSLGWVYQFWQRDEKERINKSEVKIGAAELPSVTQLFTEDYMVLFLLHNTLGAWWTAKRKAEGKDYRLPDYEWTYLRLNGDGSPTAGNFDAWPKAARLLRLLDPCMGSGHFLTFALPILARMRQQEEGSTLTEAICSVLADNIFGLELDARCSQIAAFNLALTAWRMVGRPVQLPAMNLACSGLGINASRDSWVALAGDRGLARDTLSELYATFQKAPTLGSLIDPTRVGRPLLIAKFDEVWPLLERALGAEHQSDESRELAIAARGVLGAARILAGRFTLVVTNVPYLGRGKQHDDLREYSEEFYPEAKADLATCFVDRSLRFCSEGGACALVTPQNWLFLTGYKKLRERLLKWTQWDMVARLGPRAFETITGEVVNVALVGLTNRAPSPEHSLAGWDVAAEQTPTDKLSALAAREVTFVNQAAQLLNPDQRIILDLDHDASGNFSEHAQSFQGAVTGDLERFTAYVWEIADIRDVWEPFRTAVSSNSRDDGLICAIRWQHGSGDLAQYARESRDQLHDMHESGQKAWGKSGVAINRVSGLYATIYDGTKFDNNVAVLIPDDSSKVLPMLCFCQSEEFPRSVRNLDQTLEVTNQTLRKVAFDIERWRRVAAEKFPDGCPSPISYDPRQWVFKGHPRESDRPLHVAVARLTGYRWPRQTGPVLQGCPAVEPDHLERHADTNGIVCLSSLSGEAPGADRLRELLSHAFGSDWSASKLAEILGDSESLEPWLRDKFFAEHCELFHSRPFVWHIWDGRKDGFHALVNYHKLAGPNGEGRKTLEKLIYTLLGDWISRQKAEVASGADGAEARLSAALHLHLELEKILKGEPPYDIFVRWKPIHEQAIGWEPDLNDGVRLNMRPWLMAKPYQPSKKDACILRVTPIKLPLGKDRGKEPDRNKEDFPWFAETRDRNNDIHLTLDQKRNAREREKA
jgi:N-6 DNA Methylase